MKFISTLVAVSIAIGAVVATADAEHVERALVLGGEVVQVGMKRYTAGIRETPDGTTYCGGALIDPTHVLITAYCTIFKEPNYMAVGTHYINGSNDGEQIKVVKGKNHTKFRFDSKEGYDFAVLTLEKASKFKPIQLANADDSDISAGMWATLMGWGDMTYPGGARSKKLRNVGLKVWNDEKCAATISDHVATTYLCAGGAAGKDACAGDWGGPLIKERGPGDSDDILIGLASWGFLACGKEGTPSVYSRVSTAIEWINSVINPQ